MKIKILHLKHYLLFCFVISAIISSCSEKSQSSPFTLSNLSQDSIDTVIAKLDPKANLIYQDKENNYWFGSKGIGVYRYDGKKLKLFTSENGLCSTNILSIQEDAKGILYFDSPDGICKFDGKQFSLLEAIESKDWKSEPGDLWFRKGWDSNGPYRFDGKHLYHLQFPKNKMEPDFRSKYPDVTYNPYGIYSIYKDNKGNLWFGTSNLGIYHYDGKEVSWMYENHLTDTPKGGSFGIRSIIEDNAGYFWISHSKYKYKVLTAKELLDIPKPLNYERHTGIVSQGLESLYFLSMVKDNDGDIWMVSYDNGVWRNNGETLQNYPINDGKSNIPLFQIYKDNAGDLWVGTQNHGAYKFNGVSFDKFKI